MKGSGFPHPPQKTFRNAKAIDAQVIKKKKKGDRLNLAHGP